MGRPDLAPEAGVDPDLPHLHGSLGPDPDRNADAVAGGSGSSQSPC